VSTQWALHLESFVALGRHGTMDWLEDTQERRAHPQALWAEAKSAIVVGMNYGPASTFAQHRLFPRPMKLMRANVFPI